MELISVIIPVYQVERYLEACIVSVQNQTYKNLEIILVDDGSLDESGMICDTLAEKDVRIRVIHKTNEGAAEARNAGLSVAHGKYITFIDSDDSVDGMMIEVLYNALKEHNTKISACNYLRCKKQRLVCDGNPKISAQVYDSADYLYRTRNLLPVGKLYDRRIFDRKRFVKGQLYEDIYLIPQILIDCQRITVINDRPLYFYTQRLDSSMGKAQIAVGKDYCRHLFFTEVYAKKKYGNGSEKYQKILAFCIRTALSRLSAVKNEEYYRSSEYIRVMRIMIVSECGNIMRCLFLTNTEKYICFLSLLCLQKSMELWIAEKKAVADIVKKNYFVQERNRKNEKRIIGCIINNCRRSGRSGNSGKK